MQGGFIRKNPAHYKVLSFLLPRTLACKCGFTECSVTSALAFRKRPLPSLVGSLSRDSHMASHWWWECPPMSAFFLDMANWPAKGCMEKLRLKKLVATYPRQWFSNLHVCGSICLWCFMLGTSDLSRPTAHGQNNKMSIVVVAFILYFPSFHCTK